MAGAEASNPLLETHQQAQAEFQSWADVQIVSTFGQPQIEYAAIRKSVGMIDLPQRAFLQLIGRDRLVFLNNLLTNQTYDKETKAPLAAGRAVYAFILNARTGRIIADVNVLELGDSTLLEVDARIVSAIRQHLERYLFNEQVQIAQPALHEIALHGPGAAGITGQMIEPMSAQRCELLGVSAILWRDDPAGVPGYHLVIPSESARFLWMSFLSRDSGEIGKRPLRPVGWAAFNATRIEGGRPIFGIDFDDNTLPAETGQLSRAVSLTKGCYAGQEIVARMHARQQIPRQIVGIRFADDALPVAASPLQDEQSNQIGVITSSTISPVLSNAAIALGLVKKPFMATGSVVRAPAEGAMRTGVVCEIPFLPGEGASHD